MKKLIGIILMATVASSLAGGLNAYDNNSFTTLLDAVSTTGSGTGTVVDVSAYKGIGAVIIAVSGAQTDPNYEATVTLQHATASAGTYSTVTNQAGSAVSASVTGTNAAAVSSIKLELANIHRYVRAVYAATATNEAAAVSAVLVTP